MSIARHECGSVHGIEFSHRLAGPSVWGDHTRARVRARGGGCDRRALCRGPAQIQSHKRRFICREHTCQLLTVIEQNLSNCTPGRVWSTLTIGWITFLLCFGGHHRWPSRELATTWKTVWSHIKPYLQSASDTCPFCGGAGSGARRARVAPPGPTPAGPIRTHRHLKPDTRGVPSHGQDIGPDPRQAQRRAQELSGQARRPAMPVFRLQH